MGVATLRVVAPDGCRTSYDLTETHVVVGRRSPTFVPDVVLEPDPARWVGRSHCRLEHVEGRWWVTDNGSVNGTLLRRAGTTFRLAERTALQHGDTLLVVGAVDDDGDPVFWELVLLDPHATRTGPAPSWSDGLKAPSSPEDPGATPPSGRQALRYDWVSARAFRCEGSVEYPLEDLRPQGHRLLRYMAERGRGYDAVACSHDELIGALWGESAERVPDRSHTRTDLAGVVRDTRRAIEVDPSHPVLLLTVTGYGYRLVVHREAEDSSSSEHSECR